MSTSSQYSSFNTEQKVRSGKYWNASVLYTLSNPVPPNVANRINLTLENPAGSGKNIFFTHFEVAANVGASYPTIYRTPTGNLPTTVIPYFNADASIVSAPVALIKSDSFLDGVSSFAYTGGTIVGTAKGPGALLGGNSDKELSPLFFPPLT